MFCVSEMLLEVKSALGDYGREKRAWSGKKKRLWAFLFFFFFIYLFIYFFVTLVLSMLQNPLGNVLGKAPLSFLSLDPLGSDLDKFPAPSVRGSRLDTRPILDSRSSSPSDSDTSGFSSGSDHLSDLIVCNVLRSWGVWRWSYLYPRGRCYSICLRDWKGCLRVGCRQERPSGTFVWLFTLSKLRDTLNVHEKCMLESSIFYLL